MEVQRKSKDGSKHRKFMRALRRLMYEQGLDSRSLARAVGVSDATVSEWLMGKYLPKAKRVNKLASVLGLTVPEFVDLIDPQRRPRVHVVESRT